jgi:hypothetical protein
LGCPDDEPLPPRFEVFKYDLDKQEWDDSSLNAFLKAQKPPIPTDIWIHGNRTDAEMAREIGIDVYQQLTAGASGDKPIRFVIYSWQGAPTKGIKEDARRKAARTNSEGFYLAWLVNQINHAVPVNIIGYSFGARIATGALHLLGGGTLCGHSPPKPIEPRAPMQCVLIAAAVNNDWLAVGHAHGDALPVVQRMLALNNGCDRALKHYPVIDPCNRPEALGYTGAVGPLGDNAAKLRQFDMCCAVGKQHYWGSYFYNSSIVAKIRPYVGLAN